MTDDTDDVSLTGELKQAKTRVTELKDGMVIKAYCRFSRRYTDMDGLTCEFIRHNFRGTRCIVIRGQQKLQLPIRAIETGDSLIGVYDFPPALQKITRVTPELVNELKRRGVLEFITVQPVIRLRPLPRALEDLLDLVGTTRFEPSPPPARSHRKSGKAAEIVNQLVDSVQQSVPVREQTVGALEEEMDQARHGHLSIKGIQNSVDRILANQSVEALIAISSLKTSRRTYDHCVDVGVIFQSVYLKIQHKRKKPSVFRNENQAMLGGFLHDYGKSTIPKPILESEEPFAKNSRAMQIIRSHPVHGAKQLTAMNMPDCIVNLALYHHVKLNPAMLSSYPQDCDISKVGFEARLLAIIDIYQALVGTRQYKKSWSPPATMRYLDALAGVEIDQLAWDLFLREMGVYPRGSLVELFDGSLGFVLNVPGPGKDLLRPLVAVVRNRQGEDLSHHHLLDLEVERDMKIVKDVDRYQVFGEEALERFTGLTV